MMTRHLLKHESLDPTEGEFDRILQSRLERAGNDVRQPWTTKKHQKALQSVVHIFLLLQIVRNVT
jgi:hypothetical protein